MFSGYEKQAPHEGHCFAVFARAGIDDGYDGLVVAAAEY